MTMTRIFRAAAPLLAASVLLVACSSDDGADARADVENIDGGSADPTASASGTASGDIDPDATGDGGYEYASNVAAHRLVVLDVCEINGFLAGDSINFGAVKAVYEGGKNSVNSDGSVRTIGDFASGTDKAHGLDDYYATPTPLDDFVRAAIDGAGQFADAATVVRSQAINKGIQNQIMVAWTIHELNEALEKAEDGNFDSAEGSPHNWDEAWAFYRGASPDCAPYATADKRGADFGTLADDGETSISNQNILAAFNAGRDALLGEDEDAAKDAYDEIIKSIVVTYSQATVRYGTLAAQDIESDSLEDAAEHQIEGYAFWRIIEALAADAGADVDTINDILLDGKPGTNGNGDDIAAALAPLWEDLGITDADIGELQ